MAQRVGFNLSFAIHIAVITTSNCCVTVVCSEILYAT